MNIEIKKTLQICAGAFLVPLCSASLADVKSTSEFSSAKKLFNKGTIYGRIYNDANSNGFVSFREKGIQGVVVYADLNDNGIRDDNEPFDESGFLGFYRLKGLNAGDYTIRQEVPFGWRNISGGEGEVIETLVITAPKSDLLTPQIIGGDVTTPNEYSFMAAVGSGSQEQFSQFCGGALISDQWVVTAAHCSDGVTPESVNILVGTNNTNNGSGQVLGVEEVILHPEYSLDLGVSGGYDIALWKLAQPLNLAESGLQTVAMLSQQDKVLANDGVLATTVGWGVSNLESQLLQDVHLPIFDTQVCQDVYADSINFDTQICGGVPNGGIDACQGDSGGPLLVRDFEQDVWKLAGVTSYGNGCALPGNPGVWARVSELSDWVKQTTMNESRVHQVTVKPWGIVRADFGNQSTRLEPAQEIDPRWQLADVTFTNTSADSLNIDWSIIDESNLPRVFECIVDGDGFGSELTAEFVDCFEGANSLVLPPLNGDGVYVSSFSAVLGGTQFDRKTPFIIGSPTEEKVNGSLVEEDAIDPDFNASYFVDYFDIKELSGEKAIAIRVTADTLDDLFISLYDRDTREQLGFGGVLDTTFVFGQGAVAELILEPKPDVNYLVGVSTFSVEAVGDYTISLLNEGKPVATTLSAPELAALKHRGLRKDPIVKSLVSYPVVN